MHEILCTVLLDSLTLEPSSPARTGCPVFIERPKIPEKYIILCNCKVSEAITERELAPTITKVLSGKLLAKIEKTYRAAMILAVLVILEISGMQTVSMLTGSLTTSFLPFFSVSFFWIG